MELVPYLRNLLGNDNVIASDIKALPRQAEVSHTGPFVYCDVYVLCPFLLSVLRLYMIIRFSPMFAV